MSIVYGVRSPEAFVYHYTSARTAIDHILKDRTLLLSQFGATNDPKESKDWSFAGFRGRIAQTFVDLRFSEAVKQSARVACFCTDAPGLTGDHLADILLRGLAKPRMWAQYADKHTGVCLVFDRSKLLIASQQQLPNAKIRHGLVDYVDRATFSDIFSGAFAIDLHLYDQLGPDAYAERHIEQHQRELFFEKLMDWRDEREWRLLVHGINTKCLLNIENCLVGVVHGASMPGATSKEIIKLTDQPEVDHIGLQWRNHAPWYDFQRQAWGYQERIVLRRAGFLRD